LKRHDHRVKAANSAPCARSPLRSGDRTQRDVGCCHSGPQWALCICRVLTHGRRPVPAGGTNGGRFRISIAVSGHRR
jgi:hypothetical protein